MWCTFQGWRLNQKISDLIELLAGFSPRPASADETGTPPVGALEKLREK
jgi:hypothetical protein